MRIKFTAVFILVFTTIHFFTALSFAQKEVIRTIRPIIACTAMGCPREKPCCNTCKVQGWRTVKDNTLALPGKQRVPAPEINGCGKIISGQKTFRVKGFYNETSGAFQVTKLF